MRALITGGHGFAGRHLAKYLVSCGDDVIATYHPSEKSQINDKSLTPLPNQAQSVALDVCDPKSVAQLFQVARPDAVYHLAGISFVPEGEEDFAGVMRTNYDGTLNLIRGILEQSLDARLVFISSASVYGDPRPGTLPFTENSPLRPIDNYGLSKCAADLAVFKFAFRDGLDAIRIRPFPHIGPGQSDRFAISSFARQLAEIKLKKKEPIIKVGNLEAKRDYIDVSDAVRGYREAFLNGKKTEAYNLCSGNSYSMKDLLDQLIKIAEVEVEIVEDPSRVRAVDIPVMYGSAEKAFRDFGWKPRIELEGTLSSIFAWWLESLA